MSLRDYRKPTTVRDWKKLYDLYAELDQEIKELEKDKTKLRTWILEQVNEQYNEADEAELIGNRNILEISRTIPKFTPVSNTFLIKKLGERIFLSIAKVGITELRAVTNNEQFEELTTKENTDSRRIKVKANNR